MQRLVSEFGVIRRVKLSKILSQFPPGKKETHYAPFRVLLHDTRLHADDHADGSSPSFDPRGARSTEHVCPRSWVSGQGIGGPGR